MMFREKWWYVERRQHRHVCVTQCRTSRSRQRPPSGPFRFWKPEAARLPSVAVPHLSVSPMSSLAEDIRVLVTLCIAATVVGCGVPRAEGHSAAASAGSGSRAIVQQSWSNGTPHETLASYDSQVVSSIQHSWYDLVSTASWPTKSRSGVVVIAFTLHSNGQVSGIRVAENTADEKAGMISQQAILQAAPFPPWSLAIHETCSDACRPVHFSFHYDY